MRGPINNILLPDPGSERIEQQSKIVRQIRAQNIIYVIKQAKLEDIAYIGNY